MGLRGAPLRLAGARRAWLRWRSAIGWRYAHTRQPINDGLAVATLALRHAKKRWGDSLR